MSPTVIGCCCYQCSVFHRSRQQQRHQQYQLATSAASPPALATRASVKNVAGGPKELTVWVGAAFVNVLRVCGTAVRRC